MITFNSTESFPDLTGHVTHRDFNHRWEHLIMALHQILPLFTQRILTHSNCLQHVAGVPPWSRIVWKWLLAVSDCRMSLTPSTINRMVAGENLYLCYTSCSWRLSRGLLRCRKIRGRLIVIVFCLLRRRHLTMAANVWENFNLLFCRLK